MMDEYARGMQSARDWINLFDQNQKDWEQTFDRETVQKLVKGLDAKIASYRKRTETSG